MPTYEISGTDLKLLQEMTRLLGHDSKNRTAPNMIAVIHNELMSRLVELAEHRKNQFAVKNFMEAFEEMRKVSGV